MTEINLVWEYSAGVVEMSRHFYAPLNNFKTLERISLCERGPLFLPIWWFLTIRLKMATRVTKRSRR